jgi:hypothetical protein
MAHDRPRAVQVDLIQDIGGVGAEHDHAIVDRRRCHRRQRVL